MSGGRPGLPIPASWRQWPLTPLRGAITSRFTTSHKFSVRSSDSDLPFSLSATLLMELPLFSLSLECVTYCILSLSIPLLPLWDRLQREREEYSWIAGFYAEQLAPWLPPFRPLLLLPPPPFCSFLGQLLAVV